MDYSDSNTTPERLKPEAQRFAEERDWRQFHTLKNLSKGSGLKRPDPQGWERAVEEPEFTEGPLGPPTNPAPRLARVRNFSPTSR